MLIQSGKFEATRFNLLHLLECDRLLLSPCTQTKISGVHRFSFSLFLDLKPKN
ncbi:MAG: hypothetical protein ACRC8Y_14140 [Chroococcales cyanobacterium]